MKLVIFIPVLLLAACVSAEERCSSYGFKPGTQAYANCAMQVSQENSDRAQRVGQALSSMTLSGSGYQQPQRIATRCVRNYYGYTCN